MVVWNAPLAALARALSGAGAADGARRGPLFHRAERDRGPDPFETLALQVRLERLAAQVRALEADPHIWARARRLMAVEAAYDAVLVDAWRLAGAGAALPAPAPPPDRTTAELDLAARGWTW
ncbi:hypothetical protein [Cellulomonas endophytica]|uniref:hypothetical protein n=1 Tax=Cellulomonas endophytica TaxID=2494735 RepID=UPI001011D9B8|nr:hypothetical protein [Cellulomonas endophytica]